MSSSANRLGRTMGDGKGTRMSVGEATAVPAEQLDALFFALADPTRRAILARLAAGEATATELAAPFDMTQPAISKHLKVLERAGLISRGREAQRRPCRLEVRPFQVAIDWLERYRQLWEGRFQQLDSLLEQLQGTGEAADRPEAA